MTRAGRFAAPAKRTFALPLSKFSLEALAGGGERGQGQVAMRLARAVRLYLDGRAALSPGWAYPAFLRDSEPSAEAQTELSLDEGLWRALEEEAGRQGVTASRLASHAILYCAAELDSGRITQRILDDLDGGEA